MSYDGRIHGITPDTVSLFIHRLAGKGVRDGELALAAKCPETVSTLVEMIKEHARNSYDTEPSQIVWGAILRELFPNGEEVVFLDRPLSLTSSEEFWLRQQQQIDELLRQFSEADVRDILDLRLKQPPKSFDLVGRLKRWNRKHAMSDLRSRAMVLMQCRRTEQTGELPPPPPRPYSVTGQRPRHARRR